MAVKVSNMAEANSVTENDYLMIVQGGANKKIKASKFQQKDESSPNAQKLDGKSASDFVSSTNGIAPDANKLGGISSENYATKDYVDTAMATGADYFWACPRPWFRTDVLPDQFRSDGTADPTLSTKYAFCNGQSLKRSEYPDLYRLIGLNYTRSSNGVPYDDETNFRIPNLCGKFMLGANTSGTAIKTTNLPSSVYAGKNQLFFDENGQYVLTSVAGIEGGDPTTVQEDVTQMAAHSHNFKDGRDVWLWDAKNNHHSVNKDGDSQGYNNYNEGENIIKTKTGVEGSNYKSDTKYPPNPVSGNYNNGMLSMPPFLSFAWVMRLKP